MKKALIIIASIVVLVVAALLVVPAFIPVETYKAQILNQIEQATGRKANIEGDFAFSLLPRVEFTAGRFSLANAAGGKSPNMVTLERLDVRVEVLPLLGGNLQIDSFVLEKPVINLEVDRQGNPNWQFAAATTGKTENKSPEPGDRSGSPLEDISLGDVRLVGGNVSYFDARSETAYVVRDINMSLSLPSLAEPMKADGSLVYNDEKIDLEIGMANPKALMEGGTTALNAAIDAQPVALSFKGEAGIAGKPKAAGTLALNVPSVRKLADWAGIPMTAPGEGFGLLKIEGNVGVDGQKYRFSDAQIEFDKIKGKGAFRFDGSGSRPHIDARLDLGLLDINPYLPEAQAPQEKPTSSTAKKGKAEASEGWSEEPIDLSGLRQVDADAELTVETLKARKITIGKSRIKLSLKEGRLVTDLTEMALYEGKGKAQLTVDASSAVPTVSSRFALDGLKANPALSDAIDLDRIEGTLTTETTLQTKGKSQRALISALNGSGKVEFMDGAIRGINLGAMVRNVKSAFLDPDARQEQKTDFAKMAGTYTIRNGIVSNDDFSLLSPLLRVSGKGTVDLPDRTLQYRIEPKLAATSKGQGGKTDVAGVMVPVVITGPWSNLSYRPDLSSMIEGVAKDPKKTLEGVKKLIPGQSTTSPDKESNSPLPDPTDTIKGLFGR